MWNAGPDGSCPAVARAGKNGDIQICVPLVARTPNGRTVENVQKNTGSFAAPMLCWNGAQRAHELVSPLVLFAVASWTGACVPSDLTTQICADESLYELPTVRV